MKGFGVSLVLGRLLMGLLVVARSIRVPHSSVPHWEAVRHHTLDEVEGFQPPASRRK